MTQSGLEQNGLWFKSSQSTDQQISQLFGATVDEVIPGDLHSWPSSERGLIALLETSIEALPRRSQGILAPWH